MLRGGFGFVMKNATCDGIGPLCSHSHAATKTIFRGAPMSFKMDCPLCKRTLNVTEKAFGKTVPCPGCNQPVTVPLQSPMLHPVHEFEPNDSATPAAQVRRPASSPTPPAESAGSETGTCAFCRKPMSLDAIQCPSCQNWRRDIHQLIDTYRKLQLAQLATVIIGGLIAFFVIQNARESATLFKPAEFPTGPVVLIGVATAVIWLTTQVPSVSTRHRIEELTKGLWQRPWWTF